jgi:hypothetical protein
MIQKRVGQRHARRGHCEAMPKGGIMNMDAALTTTLKKMGEYGKVDFNRTNRSRNGNGNGNGSSGRDRDRKTP